MSNQEKPRPRSILAEKAAAEMELAASENETEWQEVLEERLGRKLERPEIRFLEKLDNRWEKFQESGTIAEYDLVHLHPKWEVQTYDSLDLWPETPESFPEFWGGLVVAFKKRKVKTPEFLDALPGLEEAQGQFAEWERSESAAAWSERFDVLSNAPYQGPRTLHRLRVRISPDDATLELGSEPEPDEDTGEVDPSAELVWTPIEEPEPLGRFAATREAGQLDLDHASAFIWAEWRGFWSGEATVRLDLTRQDHAAAVRRLFEADGLEESLLTFEGESFRRSDNPLVWRCRRPLGENAERDWELALSTTSGDLIHYPVRLLPGPNPLYLGDDALFAGPPSFEDGTTVLPRHDIPAEVLETSTGVDFLGQIQAILPEDLQNRVQDHRMEVQVRAEVRKTGGSEAVFFGVEAADDDKSRLERYVKTGWELRKEAPPAKDGSLRRYDRNALIRWPRILEAFRTSWQEAEEEFRIRITKPFPGRFAAWAEGLPETVHLDCDEELASILADPVQADISIEVNETEDLDWFDLKVVVQIQGMDLSPKEIRELVAARGGYVRLEDRGWLRLSLSADEGTEEAVRDLGIDAFDVSGKAHRMHALQLVGPTSKEVIDKKAWQRIQDRVEALQTELRPDPPAGLNEILRPYQREGFHFLVYLAANGFGGVLADDMGLGKTLQSLSWIAWLREEAALKLGKKVKKLPPTLVVCPKSVLDVWGEECKRFLPDLKVELLRNREDLDMKRVEQEVDLLVINYAQLRNAIEELEKTEFLAAVLDEGQQIKNPDSKAAKAAGRLVSQHRLVLSGTPIENRLLDVWSLMNFAMPGVLGNRKYFRERFDLRKDGGAHLRLSSRLRPFLLRRTKLQVATDLPPRTEEEIPCEMGETQRALYNAELEKAREMLLGVEDSKGLAKARFNVLSSLLRLRQICCHPTLVADGDESMESAKMEALFYHLDQLREEGHKVLVFSQFTTMLDLIRARLEEDDRPYHLLTGKTENRSEVVRNFQSSSDPAPFLLSLKAGGSGLNLTAASYVILYDPWWNPAVERQAIDRTHRIGQVRPVNAYRLVTRDSVEEKIRVLQKAKENLVGDVLAEETFSQTLQLDDLKFLLGSE